MSRTLFERLLHKHTLPAEEAEPAKPDGLPIDELDTPIELISEGVATDEDDLVECEATYPLTSESAVIPADIETHPQEKPQGNAMSQLLASDASAELKKRALRSLFFSGQFSEVDPLNEYHQDFSQIKPLSSEIAGTLRNWTAQKMEEIENELTNFEPSTPNPELSEEQGALILAENDSATERESDAEPSDSAAQRVVRNGQSSS